MKLYQQTGYKRLAILISILGFIVTLMTLIILENHVDKGDVGDFLVASSLIAVGVYIMTRLVYWVIDGFSSS